MNKAVKPRASARVIVAIIIAVITIASIGVYAFMRTPLYSTLTTTRLVYSQSALLQETWSTYKADSIETGSGRTIDNHTSNITSSRAHANTLLRSVSIDDKQTFDKAWTWSKNNEQLENKLFASTYGPRTDKTYGYLDTATDSTADTNIALALLMAYGRWNDTTYLEDAKAIISSLYDNSVVLTNGSPVMADTTVAADSADVRVSPATLNVAAYKEFAKVDPSHNWTVLVDNSYDVYDHFLVHNDNVMPNSSTIALDGHHYTLTEKDEVFNDSAAIGVWNLGLDYSWNHDDRSLAIMKKLTLAREYRTTGAVLAGSATESPVTYGKLIGYFQAVDPTLATTVVTTELLSQYNQDQQSWIITRDANDQSWLWFGVASGNGQIRQLTEIK